MLGFFKSKFGKKQPEQRALEHPRDLKVGDMLEMSDSFALPKLLRNKTLGISAVDTYEYRAETATTFTLEGEADRDIYLSLEGSDSASGYLAFSITLSHEEIEQLFDLDAFAEIFDGEGDASLTTNSEHEGQLSGWAASNYHQTGLADEAYLHKGDFRDKAVPTDEDSGQHLMETLLESQDEKFFLTTEVYDNGDTEVSLGLYRPLGDIKALWPGQS